MSFLDDIFGLNGKTAIIAGGAGVIGKIMSDSLMKAGANIIIWSRSRASLDKALNGLSALTRTSDRIDGYQVDTGIENEVADALKRVVSRFGPPEILVNAVGGNIAKSSFVNTDLEQFEEVLRLNLIAGLVVPTKIIADYWIKHKIKGTIINLASMTSYNPLSGVWAYSAAKAGVFNLTKGLANELADYGIRVNAIAPGFFLGKQNKALLVDDKTGMVTARGKAVIDHTPFGRFGEIDELVGVTLFLASNNASGFVTGISIPVDGGYLAYNI